MSNKSKFDRDFISVTIWRSDSNAKKKKQKMVIWFFYNHFFSCKTLNRINNKQKCQTLNGKFTTPISRLIWIIEKWKKNGNIINCILIMCVLAYMCWSPTLVRHWKVQILFFCKFFIFYFIKNLIQKKSNLISMS